MALSRNKSRACPTRRFTLRIIIGFGKKLTSFPEKKPQREVSMRKLLGLAAAAALIVTAGVARADEPPLKIGIVMTYSGPFATYGHQVDIGVATWLKAHGDAIAGRKIELIRKDDTGLAPDVSKRVTQELAVRDKVDIDFRRLLVAQRACLRAGRDRSQDSVLHYRRGNRWCPAGIPLHGAARAAGQRAGLYGYGKMGHGDERLDDGL